MFGFRKSIPSEHNTETDLGALTSRMRYLNRAARSRCYDYMKLYVLTVTDYMLFSGPITELQARSRLSPNSSAKQAHYLLSALCTATSN